MQKILGKYIQIYKLNTALFLEALMLLSPVMFLFYQENGLTVTELFLFQGIFYLTSVVSEFFIGYLSDLISKKTMLLLSFLIFLTVSFAWMLCHGFWAILLGEIFFGISKVLRDNSLPCYLHEYLDNHNKKDKMVKFFGYSNFSLAFGTAVGSLLGTFIYKIWGSFSVLLTEVILLIIAVAMILSLPKYSIVERDEQSSEHNVMIFVQTVKEISKNIDFKYHILLSGLLTSCSILFALSFQPLMQKALFPIFLFGVVAFLNHSIRALAGIIAGKFLNNFNLNKLVIPLYFLYILGFVFLISMAISHSKTITMILIPLICLIIGVQLTFTILHVSRLQKLISKKHSGKIMFVNNIITRVFSIIILFLSRIFLSNNNLQFFYLTIFCIFLFVGCCLVHKIYKFHIRSAKV